MNEETVRTLSKVLSRNAEIYAENIRSKISKLRSDCMSEWLTTGEMIDKLKVGEIAELKNTYVKGIEDIAYNAVIRDNEGFKWYRIDSDKKDSECFEINNVVINWEWRILPNYVSFEEAMEALNKGKITHFHPFHNQSVTVHPDANLQGWIETYTWKDLITGKWTIENV